MNDDLAAQMDVLVEQLADTAPEDCGKLLDEFTLSSGATATLTGPDGRLVDTGAQIALQAVYESGDMIVTTAERDTAVSFGTTDSESGDHVSVTMSEQSTIAAEVRFSGREESYTLYVTPRLKAENVAVRALVQMAPWLLLVLLTFSLLCAFFYSRYITRPIVRMSDIAGKMAELDFHWECGETRRDEIGQLGRSLDAMAEKLSTALTELESANQALRGEVERERELDRQRMAFFNAASPELKTGHHPEGTADRNAGGRRSLSEPGQVSASLSSGDGAHGEPGSGDVDHLPDGGRSRSDETGAGGAFRLA